MNVGKKLLLLLIGAGGLLLWIRPFELTKPTSSVFEISLEAISSGANIKGCQQASSPISRWKPSFVYQYAFDRSISLNRMQKSLANLQTRGRLLASVVRTSSSQTDLIFTAQLFGIKSTEISSDLGKKIIKYINERDHWEKLGVAVRLDARGAILSVNQLQKSGDSDPLLAPAQNIIKDIVASFVFPRPIANANQNTIEVKSQDSTGSYLAKIDAANSLCFQKGAKFAYLRHTGKSDVTVVDSLHESTFGEDGQVTRAVGSDQIAAGPESVLGKSTYEFSLKEIRPLARQKFELAQYTDKTSLSGSFSHIGAAYGEDGKTAGLDGESLSWPEVVKTLNAIVDGARDEKTSRISAFNELARYIALHPQETNRLEELALATDPRSDRYRILIGMINSLAPQEAQAKLARIYKSEKTNVIGKETILNAFALAQYSPSSEVQTILRDAFASQNANFSYTAGLAMGATLRRAEDPLAVAMIKKGWQEARATEEHGNISSQRRLLQYMGNSGQEQFLPNIQSVLASQDANQGSLKADALYSLRFIQTPEAKEIISNSLLNAKYDAMEEAALNAISHEANPESYESTLVQCVSEASRSSLKRSCANLIVSFSKSMPNAIEYLRKIKDGRHPASLELKSFLASKKELAP